MKYRTRPDIEIEAIQFTGENVDECIQFGSDSTEICWECHVDDDRSLSKEGGRLVIETLEGELTVSPNDYIIKGTLGEFYPCKPEVFEKKYEAVAKGE